MGVARAFYLLAGLNARANLIRCHNCQTNDRVPPKISPELNYHAT